MNSMINFSFTIVSSLLLATSALAINQKCEIRSNGNRLPGVFIDGSEVSDYWSLQEAIDTVSELQNKGVCSVTAVPCKIADNGNRLPGVFINRSEVWDYWHVQEAVDILIKLQTAGICQK